MTDHCSAAARLTWQPDLVSEMCHTMVQWQSPKCQAKQQSPSIDSSTPAGSWERSGEQPFPSLWAVLAEGVPLQQLGL